MEKQRDRRQGEGGQAAKRLGSFYRGFVNINRVFFFFFFFSCSASMMLNLDSPVWGVTGGVVLLCLDKNV